MSEDSNEYGKTDERNKRPRHVNQKMKKCISDYNLISGINTSQTQKVRDYELIKEIGRGAYGTVHLARKEDSQNVVAIKVLDKLFLSKQEGKIEEALIERDVLSMCNHPSIIKIISSFQTTNKLFYVLEYAPNRDLDYLLRKFGTLPEALAKFYAAEILNTLEYLHKTKHISHNDLKPGNIMLDDNYHLKFIDFSTAKVDGKKYDAKAKKFVDSKLIVNDVVGTAEYCSPEMANMQLTDYKTNDVWAYGCIIYHFYHGRTPFKGTNDYQTFANVRTGKFTINQSLPNDIKDLITKLLVIDTKHRIGCKESEGISELKSHPYFNNVDWENITKAQVPLPVDLLKKLSSKLQTGDNSSEFWANICNEINSKNKNEYEIEHNGTYFILEDYYYNEKDNPNRISASEGIKDSTLVYEGIVTRVGMINTLMKLRLTSNKKILCYNNRKNVFEYDIPLSKSLQMSIENESLLKINTGKFQYCFQTTKLEAIKWYNYINQTIYAE